ncbi:metallophosphoesterase family protein [Sulfitobacter pseudonitzschiae]|uniref:Metallophosphoesterase family protein n=1 Tax=Pseudosulfitobacter pseudonitzschiae TaxID=1402135 RepID=A0A9Q2NHF9_9RHOB|nr:metallophosphoesterase family protein [Pseudosulfitobacter pseudonitzschiae]MBM2291880.1 metallophosphoesterase family protein [Pseudosulfitobacter pseudonitzschiae]MBM2296798.1 metallophosphoesterase family protein [Pseudosulfitobacter pseudonitzschiae]MBM2301711.1 metallophosphoesterase family protein [Pseudosulfitobacter pseudonitzschiae]MBM2311494.1 metallophosphoesterase family protein [Pseudosulfitobacter pseudonitzschiae]MBM2316408.1 metallophosphoesterase family protein [Pseudosulfi
MRILAFSDLHHARARAADLVAASGDADLVIGAGDYCNMRHDLEGAMALLDGIAAPLVLVPGNAESVEELRAAAPRATVLHGDAHDVGGLRLFGMGYGVPPTPFGQWSCDLDEDAAATMLAGCEGADLLICHSPPKGVVDVTSGGESVGSTAIRAAVERIQPKLMFCGHIHDCWGQEGQIGDTRVVNLGPTVNWFDLGA